MKKKRSTFSYLIEWANPHKGGYIASVMIAILGVGFGMLPYFAISKIVTLLFDDNKDVNSYFTWLGFIAIGFIFQLLFHNISTYISHKMTFTVIGEIRKMMCDKIAKMPMGNILKQNSGEMKTLIVEKVDSIEPTLAHLVPEMTSKLTIPIVIWIIMMMGRGDKYARYVNAQKDLNSVAVEYINGIEVIKAFNNSAKSYEKFSDAAHESAQSAIDWMKGNQFYFSASLTILPSTLLFVLPACLLFFLGDGLALNEFITIIILSIGLVPPLIGAISFTDDIAKIDTIVSNIASILDEEELVRPTKEVTLLYTMLTLGIFSLYVFHDIEIIAMKIAMLDICANNLQTIEDLQKEEMLLADKDEKPLSYDIEFKNVSFAYEKENVLNDISFQLEENTMNALVGLSGSGKSTLVNLIPRFFDIEQGEILIGSVNIKDMSTETLYGCISMVFQNVYLFVTV